MRTWTVVLSFALFAAGCDRGASLYESSAAIEKKGELAAARDSYQAVFQQFPASKAAGDAKEAYVRLSLDLAEKHIAAGELKEAESRLGEAQPQMDGLANRERFLNVKTALRDAAMASREDDAVKELFARVAAAQKLAGSELVGPGMSDAMLRRLHAGRDGAVERTGFTLVELSRVSSGRYVAKVDVATPAGAQKDEWYVQNTTNGWRVLCAQAAGAADCKDPWVYKKVDIK